MPLSHLFIDLQRYTFPNTAFMQQTGAFSRHLYWKSADIFFGSCVPAAAENLPPLGEGGTALAVTDEGNCVAI
jgi:hypothetical protein